MSEEQTGPIPPFAVDSVPAEDWSKGVRFAGRVWPLSQQGGARKIGVHIEELPPGKQSAPFHYHTLEEEHLLALEGEATLRLGAASYPIRSGDYVCFPAGQPAGHCLINTSGKPFRFLVIGTNEPEDVRIYPDSNKVMIRATREVYDRSARRDYWDGERPDEPLDGPAEGT